MVYANMIQVYFFSTISNGFNLLLTACQQKRDPSSLPNIRLLLEVGADPNAKTNRGHRPLHLVAFWIGNGRIESPIAELLLEHGAHLDCANITQDTPLDNWKKFRDYRTGRDLFPPAWTNPVLRLSCWSARTIRRNKIPYDELTKSDRDFVSMH